MPALFIVGHQLLSLFSPFFFAYFRENDICSDRREALRSEATEKKYLREVYCQKGVPYENKESRGFEWRFP